MEVDYIIVGCGLAGISFAEILKANNKSFVVFDDNSQQSSIVAGGLYNPVTLKRFTPVWKSQEQLDLALPVYQTIEKDLGIQLDYKIAVKRRFTSTEEQNEWFARSDRPGLKPFINTTLSENNNPKIKADFKLGEVLQTGRIDTKLLIEKYRQALSNKKLIITEQFKYDKLIINANGVDYKNISAKHMVFAEGFGVKNNPFFNHLPLQGSKGQLLTIHAPDLKLDYVLKSSVFIIPLGNDLYRIGATYEQNDKNNSITQEAKQTLLDKLKTFTDFNFEVVNHVAGVRPTVKDRKPLVGQHHTHKNLHILNGMGSRGVMIAPYIANQLFNCIENNTPLDIEIDCSRFNYLF
ncbi:NAD(P)/FAD-dependent oxidoreductase [Olleya aquimaris]|uniref:Glycine/D-amino acid oxidase-like deaminating enzyme n=1 Tax=Olleya aquimaris TaxID=639310 RepID=A0A327RGA1_9FLAO|nr:FAD-binding oxidoreductase [Olleya aquimaris]RAJ15185.1 glycine/D-amino acid oxidase-like deaminating enzyme [Olleya aquimaris]